jgi:hypothetical protein
MDDGYRRHGTITHVDDGAAILRFFPFPFPLFFLSPAEVTLTGVYVGVGL